MTECLRGKHSPMGNIDEFKYDIYPGEFVSGAEISNIEDLIWKK